MPHPTDRDIPQSPENQPADVRAELDQTLVSHEGTPRLPDSDPDPEEPQEYMGALESDVTPVTPLTTGPLDFVGNEPDGDDETGIDPRDETEGG